MKTKLKQLLAFVMCFVLCMSSFTVGAVGENNTLGITFTAELDKETIQVSDTDQTVVMRIKASEEVTVDGIEFTVTKDDALAIAGITGGDTIGAYDAIVTNLTTGKAAWNSADSENVSGVTELAVITFTVPAGTEAGTYNVGFSNLELTKDYGTIWENGASATATLTVTAASTVEGYTAGVSAERVTVEKGEEVSIKVSAGHATQTAFNADKMELSYDKSKITFDKDASTLNGAEVTNDTENGKLIIANYGADRSFGVIYTLVFDTIAIGTATVKLDSAGLIDKEGASESDLIAATLNPDTVNLTINEAQFSVTLPSELEGVVEGEATVAAGSSYEFTVLDTNYEYEFSATMGGEPAEVTSTDGVSFTVDQVTADLVITLETKTPKSYSVTISGDGADDVSAEDGTSTPGTTAVYNTPYVFRVNAVDGYGYQISVTINDVAYTGYTVSEGIYTIPGTAITGAVVINVEKSATEAAVSVTGEGAGIAGSYNPVATIGSPYTLNVSPETGYIYTVTATMGGNEIVLTANADNTAYTTPDVTGAIVFTITRTVDTSGVEVHEKVGIDNGTVYAVTYATNLGDGRVPTYNGNAMYWSENHQAYVYLVIGSTLSEETAKAEIGIIDGTKISVAATGDINGSGNVDASDAQYVWNMYNAYYSEFTAEVTMIEFIRADRNANYKIDLTDAQAIVSEVLGLDSQS